MMDNNQIVIVKFGSESLTDTSGLLSQSRINDHAKNMMRLSKEHEVRIVIVSSGAVAAGREYCRQVLGKETKDISGQTLAAIGNPIMANAWSAAFRPFGLAAGLILVTNQKTDASFQADDVVDIYNANDSIGGDNDWLAAHLSIRLHAKAILFATNVDGFMTKDGMVQSRVKGSEITSLTEHFFETSSTGSGGIQSKLEAAHFATQAGVFAYIANANASYAEVMARRTGTQVLQ